MEIQTDRSVEGYKRERADSEEGVIGLVRDRFPQGAYIYAVLDHAVAFGLWENKAFTVGLGREESSDSLPWEYLRELRVFNQEQELLLRLFDGRWSGRTRGSMDEKNVDRGEYYIEEKQKLWGKVKDGNQGGIPGWSLLTSERGSQIQIPVNLSGQGIKEAAIRVRRYMRVPRMDSQELVYQTDIRMVDFCLWEQEAE